MHLQFYLLVLTGLVILLSSVIKGITGFGFSLLAIPVLSFIFPMNVLVPALVIFNLVTSILVLLKLKEKVRAYYLIPMMIASLLGIPFGIYILTYIDANILKLVISFLIILFSLKMLSGVKLAKKNLDKPIVFAGFISGLLTSSISIGGPTLALALDRKGYSKELFRGIFIWFMVVSSLFSTVAFYYKGLLSIETIKYSAFALPLLFIGSSWGVKIASRINAFKFRKLVIYLNVFTGLIMLISTILALKH